MTGKTGLVLSGGGARAAYQVGVLQAIAELLPVGARQPFPIITGTSAGAINALGLAGRPGSFLSRTRALTTMWGSLQSESIYRTHFWGVTRNALDILLATLSSRYARERSLALLDNEPLRELLEDIIQFTHIERAIGSGDLHAIAVTAMNYSSGRSTTFYQGQPDIQPWSRTHRLSKPEVLEVAHLLASSALPTLFPATQVGDNFYGDGALRQTRPLSPAIHLGADKLLIIGNSENRRLQQPDDSIIVPPTIPQVMGQMLNAVFLDAIDADLETLDRINGLVSQTSQRQRENIGLGNLRVIDALTISPSQSLASIAREHIHELPRSMRLFLKSTRSIKETGSGGALSYILFERGYCKRLIELGYNDAMALADPVRQFFGLTPEGAVTRKSALWREHGPVVKKPLNPVTKAWYHLLGKKTRRINGT
ncbi:patatin [Luminiphilus syltensis NOR5-1B]|uniref:Patatin n=1 Tax=Luminiphilus syltensis NOR5-1B TaxID=565045 RepID=B8KQQ1_9GAMM|nr:patatin-like phospholipase family protein [Luminiphilus syltensis]EED36041.1 patatin [Luminiphilus syltensis NOR5-1B]